MKIVSLSVALSLALAGAAAFAQDQAPATPQTAAPPAATAPAEPHAHHMNPEKETRRLGKELNLTDDQTAKIEPIFADEAQKMSALEADTTLDDAARHQQMKKLHKSTEQQLSGILTSDQMEQMKSMHKGHHAGSGEEPINPPATS